MNVPPSLLSLPLEVRREIYTQLLLSPYAPSSSCTKRFCKKPPGLHRTRAGRTCEVLLPGRPPLGTPLYAASPLLRVSHQIRQEVSNVIHHIQTDLPWQLEMRMLDYTTLQAQWTHLPVPPSMYSPCSANFANPDRKLLDFDPITLPSLRDPDQPARPRRMSDSSTESGHDLVVSLYISPKLDCDLSWMVYYHCSKVVSNLLAVMGSWCTNSLILAPGDKGKHVPFMNTLTVLLRPPHPEYIVTPDEVEHYLKSTTCSPEREEQQRRTMEEMHQCRHLAGLVHELKKIAQSGLLYGFFKSVRVGVERKRANYEQERNDQKDMSVPSFQLCELPVNAEDDMRDKLNKLYGDEAKVWDPMTDGDKVAIVADEEVLDQPLREKQMTSHAWSFFGWVSPFPEWKGKVRSSWQPSGALTSVYHKDDEGGMYADRWHSFKRLRDIEFRRRTHSRANRL